MNLSHANVGIIPAHVETFWREFAATQAVDPSERFLEAFHFADSERSADELALLVLAGTKRASAGLIWSYEKAGARVPQVGDLSVMTNWAKTPLCVIETRQVDIIPFEDVAADFAAAEGEGDGSLAYWQRAHTAYFGRECVRIGRTFDARMPVACERFEMVYRGRG